MRSGDASAGSQTIGIGEYSAAGVAEIDRLQQSAAPSGYGTTRAIWW